MSYKIKVKAEDFIVKENALINFLDKGEYSVFLLKKIGWNTDDILKKVSGKTGVNYNLFSFGGRKDRHSISEQVVTIKGDYRGLSYTEDFCTLKFIGFSDKPISPKLIHSNHFSIIIRDIKPDKKPYVIKRIEEIKGKGFVNYFDEQRFRSYDEQGFIAEKILKKQYNGALKILLTSIRDEDRKGDKQRKRFFFENWGKWENCLEISKTHFERFTFKKLIDKKNDYLNILRSIDKRELSIYFSAYQSYLFNEVVKSIIANFSKKYIIIKGIPSELYIPTEIEDKRYEYLKQLKIPTVAEKMDFMDEEVRRIYENLLIERGIRRSMFNLRRIRKAYFKSTQRNVIEFPKILNYSFENDDLYKFRLKLLISFELSAGSYATMLIKQLFL